MLHEAGFHHALISALSSPHLNVQKGAASSLANIMTHSTLGHQLRQEVFHFGGVPLLKTLLAKDDQELKEAVVSALASLAQLEEAADQIDIQPFLHLLQSSGAQMQAATMSIVGQITSKNDFKQQQLMDAGTLPVIVDMMNSPDPATQRTAVKQVCMFATDSANWPTIRSGLPKLVEMLSSRDQSVVEETSECISTMLVDADNAHAFLSYGGHMALVPLLSSVSVVVKRHAASATAAMARTGGMPVIAAVVEAGAVKPLVELLRGGTASGNRDVQALAQDSLQALATLSQDPRAASHMGSTCLDVLFDLAEQYDEGVQRQAIYLLLNVANCDQQVRNKMVQTVRIGVMLRFMSNEHEEAQEIGVKALAATLGEGKGGHKLIDRLLSEPEFMVTLMGTFSATNKTVREFASVIVTNLLGTKSFRTRFVNDGGFGALNKLVTLNKDSTTKTRNGVAAMEILMKDGDLDFQLQQDTNESQIVDSFIDQLSDAKNESGGGANIENVIGIIARLSSQKNCVARLCRKPAALRTLLHQLAAGITKDALKDNILKIIKNCCQDEDCATIVVRLDGYSSICAAIKLSYRSSSSTKSQIRRLGIAALVEMAQHQKCRLTMAQKETLPMLVDVLKKCNDDKELLLGTTTCVNRLATNMQIADKLVDEGAFERILELLSAVVASLPTSYSPKPTQSRASTASPTVVLVAQLAPDELQQLTEMVAGCMAAFAVSTGSIDVICGSEDLIEATTTALDHMSAIVALLHSNNLAVQLSICGALELIAVDNVCREALCQASGVQKLVFLLRAENTELQLAAGRVLIRLATSESGRGAILRSSTPTVSQNSGADSVRERAGSAVTTLVSMLSQLDEPSVKVASELLSLLSCSDEGRQAVGIAEGIPSLIHVMCNFDNEELAMNILSCLLNLCFLRSNRTMLRDPDFLRVLNGLESAGDDVITPYVRRLRRAIGGQFYPVEDDSSVLEPLQVESVSQSNHHGLQAGHDTATSSNFHHSAPAPAPVPPHAAYPPAPVSSFPHPSSTLHPYAAQQQSAYAGQAVTSQHLMTHRAPQTAHVPQAPMATYQATGQTNMGYPSNHGQHRPSPSLVPPAAAAANQYPTRSSGDVPFGIVPSSVSGADASRSRDLSTDINRDESTMSDEQMARMLQEQFDSETPAPAPAPAPVPAPSTLMSDEELARKLQEEFNSESTGEPATSSESSESSNTTSKRLFWRKNRK